MNETLMVPVKVQQEVVVQQYQGFIKKHPGKTDKEKKQLTDLSTIKSLCNLFDTPVTENVFVEKITQIIPMTTCLVDKTQGKVKVSKVLDNFRKMQKDTLNDTQFILNWAYANNFRILPVCSLNFKTGEIINGFSGKYDVMDKFVTAVCSGLTVKLESNDSCTMPSKEWRVRPGEFDTDSTFLSADSDMITKIADNIKNKKVFL